MLWPWQPWRSSNDKRRELQVQEQVLSCPPHAVLHQRRTRQQRLASEKSSERRKKERAKRARGCVKAWTASCAAARALRSDDAVDTDAVGWRWRQSGLQERVLPRVGAEKRKLLKEYGRVAARKETRELVKGVAAQWLLYVQHKAAEAGLWKSSTTLKKREEKSERGRYQQRKKSPPLARPDGLAVVSAAMETMRRASLNPGRKECQRSRSG